MPQVSNARPSKARANAERLRGEGVERFDVRVLEVDRGLVRVATKTSGAVKLRAPPDTHVCAPRRPGQASGLRKPR